MEEGEEGVVPPLVIKKPPVKPKRKYKKRKVDDEEHGHIKLFVIYVLLREVQITFQISIFMGKLK